MGGGGGHSKNMFVVEGEKGSLKSELKQTLGGEGVKPICANSGAKYVDNKMPRQLQNFSVCLSITSAKNCCRLSRDLCILQQQWLQHTLTFRQGLLFGFLTVETIFPT